MKKQSKGFGKFIQSEVKGSKLKEQIRQEKKAQRKETQAYFAQKKEEARAARTAGSPSNTPPPTNNQKWGKRGNESAVKRKSANTSEEGNERGKRPSKGAARGGFKKPKGLGPRAFKKAGGYKGLEKKAREKEQLNKTNKGFANNEGNEEASRPENASRFKNSRFSHTDRKPAFKKTESGSFNKSDNKPAVKKSSDAGAHKAAKPAAKSFAGRIMGAGPQEPVHKKSVAKPIQKKGAEEAAEKPAIVNTGMMPLNKFIAHAGVCSRRDAADVVKSGKVVVNGTVITEPGHKVSGKDEIKVNGKKIAVRRNLVYILLNKPKDYITTTEDPQGRKTVLDIIRNATTERVYPIGRLDRNTTGVLLLTNDGELAQKLSHPSYEIKKIYEVTLDKPLTKKDFDAVMAGLNLEDGFVQPDALAYADSKDKSIVGIEIHSGRNRIVRRIFEHLGYDVRNLDRVMYANLTKKNVDRGKWRLLSEKEVRLLKFLNASYTNKNKPAKRG